MDKLWLVIKREYLTRVQKRSFILTTVLTPLAFALFFIIVGFIFSYESGKSLRVAVIDDNKIMTTAADTKNVHFLFPETSLEELKANFEQENIDGILHLPKLTDLSQKKFKAYYYSDQQISLDVSMVLEQRLNKTIRNYKIEALGFEKEELESLETRVAIDPKPMTDAGEDSSEIASLIAAGMGAIMGIIMYMTIFIYGMMVMRSVMEEKVNRIVEVMISTIKPFQLMLGKIIGVGAVGLTQLTIWAILIPMISFLVTLIFGFEPNQMNSPVSMGGDVPEIDPNDIEYLVGQVLTELKSQKWWLILPLFLFYSVGGYFMYASLFAAVGSAIGDDFGEGQTLTIPISLPAVIAFYIMFVAIRAPHSGLVVWSSMFPLFSPIVMPARLPFDPPWWQLLLSISILAVSSIFFVWLSARIYRVGILMYGKKVTFKELGKWLFYKD